MRATRFCVFRQAALPNVADGLPAALFCGQRPVGDGVAVA
jgi:hypothetical protein